MRSYIDHLESPEKKANFYGVFRAAAIFPAIEKPGISTRILFMGYWMIKRNIHEIGRVATLRTKEGKLLRRTYEAIREPRAFRVEVRDLLPQELQDQDFEGSLEVEFFSSSQLVFPYPAAVINYYGPAFSTVVHTAQRVYNNFEDRANNSETQVRESGFNLYELQGVSSFVSLVNGPVALKGQTLDIEAINWKNETKKGSIPLGDLKPYEMFWIYPGKALNLEAFFEGKTGACKLDFEVDWIFPRLVAGNEQQSPPSLSITHTYYDCSEATSPKDYWHEESPLFHPTSLMVPLDLSTEAFTNVYFYPIYSPSHFAIDLEIYDRTGNRVFEKKDILHIGKNKEPYQKISFKDFGLPPDQYGGRLIARRLDENPIPSRIKVALDVGFKNPLTPCNICTNLQPYTAKIEGKKSSFKWAPVLADQPRCSLWLLNTSPEKAFDRPATIDLKFHREEDNHILERPTILPPHGFIDIEIQNDPELKSFFGNKVGWASLVTTNPFLSTYYFAIHPESGCVGGDHGF